MLYVIVYMSIINLLPSNLLFYHVTMTAKLVLSELVLENTFLFIDWGTSSIVSQTHSISISHESF